MILDYECPKCGAILQGKMYEDVYCNACKLTYETGWENIDFENGSGYHNWIVGKGKTDRELNEHLTDEKSES